MGLLAQIYEFRHRIMSVGFPALVSRGSMVIWGFVTIFIIRVLPEEAYAIYAVARSLEMFGILLGGGFIHQAIMKMSAEGDTDREKRLANAGILMALIFAGFSAVLITAGGGLLQSFYGSMDLSGIPLLLAGVVVSNTISGLPRSLLISKHLTRQVMYSDLLQFIVKSGIIGVLLLAGTLRTAHQIFIAAIIANTLAFLMSSWLAGGLFFPALGVRLNGIGEVMKYAIITLGTSLANFIYSRTDILMLGKIAPDDVAAYGASRSLSGMILVVVSAANMVLLPLVSKMWSQGRRDEILPRVWSTVLLAEVLMAPVILLYVIFPRQLMDLIYSGKYNDGWPIMLVLGALAVVRPLGSFFSTASAAMGKPQYSLYSVVISSIFNIGMNFVLIPRMGGFGASLATAAAVVFGTIWVMWATSRYIERERHPS
ncbi:MAG: hypothetical protein AVO35_00490 [Candidatus Aegiribacteria sp. MLS_C]|nr:MAG: hypothetical protein AVO35_00490 [Candidatus Aegiribacteria sp. MLS_C]